MFYRCIKVQHKPINIQDRVQIQRSKETECALVWRTGLSGAPAEQWLSSASVDSANATVRYSAGQKSEQKPEAHRAVNSTCPVLHEDKASNGRPAPNPNGWLMWQRTGQGTMPVRWRTGLSGAPIASNLLQRLQDGWWL
jgi:hypothetical protein